MMPWGFKGMMMPGTEDVAWEHQRNLRGGFPLDDVKWIMEQIIFDSL
jgi:hypothetical protein